MSSSITLAAQTITASLEVLVYDSSGATVPGATVPIVNTATNSRTVLKSGAEGRVLAPSLQPGPYAVRTEAAGFEAALRSGIVLALNQAASISVTPDVGQLSEVVEVSGRAPLLAVGQWSTP